MLNIFKKGETVDLAVPTEQFALNSDWYSWFNRPDLTKYLDQGISKNTPELQAKYFKSLGDTITAPPIIVDSSLYILTKDSKILGYN